MGLRALGWGIQILWCQIVRFSCRCQIVRVLNCPFLHCGAKLSVFHCGAKLSAVPNCPRCQIVLESSEFNPRNYERVQSSPSAKVWSHKSIKDTVKLPKNLISGKKRQFFKNSKKLLGP